MSIHDEIKDEKGQRNSFVEIHQLFYDAIELILKNSETIQNGLPKKEREEIIQKLELARNRLKI
ncbi:MAG: hypothetical protein GF353_24560 [Candidatus Lokiarchaeota archaeon]|nr:hypothetical protein [Candidatus Lokiarchaeota archaeon]